MRIKDALADIFQSRGVEHVFGNPGSTELAFLASLPSAVDYVMGLQEVSVTAMASGFALRTGRTPVVNLHTGPGLGNAIGAIHNMKASHIPAVLIIGQQDSRHLHADPVLSANLVEMAAPVVKWSNQPSRATDFPRALERAFRVAETGTPGPVMLALPMDFMDGDAPETYSVVVQPAAPGANGLEPLAAWLRDGRRIAMVVGGRAGAADAWYPTVEVAERLGAEVFAAAMEPLAGFPTDHPQFRHHLPFTEQATSQVLLPYDRILVVGAPAFSYYPWSPESELRASKAVALVTDIEQHVTAMQPSGAFAVLGPMAGLMSELARLVPDVRPQAESRPEAQTTHRVLGEPESGSRISVKRAIDIVTTVRGTDSVLVDEALSSTPVLLRQWRQSRPRDYIHCADGGIGFGVPAAVGAALAQGTKAVCIVGDGSFYYSPQALWTAAQRQLDATFFVLNNGGYKILNDYHGSVAAHLGAPPPLKVTGASPAVIAEGFGVAARVASTDAELRDAMSWSQEGSGPRLIEIAIEWSERSMFR